MIPGRLNQSIEDVKTRVDIAGVIARHVDLNDHNKALCPFHESSQPDRVRAALDEVGGAWLPIVIPTPEPL